MGEGVRVATNPAPRLAKQINTMNFWTNLKKPFFVMAPMADVTDAPFRRLIARESAHLRADGTQGGPDVMWTEFVSADGLARAPEEGRKKLLADLLYTEEERPIVAQLFSAVPAHMESASRLATELGFDGVDINMGCPDRTIEKQGCGAAMIKYPDSAIAVIDAALRGTGGKIPVSVKTRIGYNSNDLETWLPTLLRTGVAAVTVHARTRKEMSLVPARWEHVRRAVEIRNTMGSSALILGNGDVLSLADAELKAQVSGADGVMLGRAIFGNPWLFHPQKTLPERITLSMQSSLPHHRIDLGSVRSSASSRTASPGALLEMQEVLLEERLRVMSEHTYLFEKLLPHKNFAIMKKHYKAYVNGFDGAKELRVRLLEAKDAEEVERITLDFLYRTPTSVSIR